jgi:hypothetical protein
MSATSTRYLTRKQAAELYADYRKPAMLREASFLTDAELEEILERLHDAACGGDGLENYRITKEGAEDDR